MACYIMCTHAVTVHSKVATCTLTSLLHCFSLHLKEEARDFLEPSTIKDLVKKYSQFINFNIYLWSSKTETVEEPIEDEAEPSKEDEKKDETEKEDEEKKEDDDVKVEEEEEEKEKKPKTKKVWKWLYCTFIHFYPE